MAQAGPRAYFRSRTDSGHSPSGRARAKLALLGLRNAARAAIVVEHKGPIAMPSPHTCDWRGKSKQEVSQLIVGGGQTPLRKRYMRSNPPLPETCICNECVELLAEVMATEHPDWRDQMLAKLSDIVSPNEPDAN